MEIVFHLEISLRSRMVAQTMDPLDRLLPILLAVPNTEINLHVFDFI